MDVFRFTNPTAPTRMEQGVIVNGLTSKMWIERYLPAGEFTFVGPATSRMKAELPIGSFVSHVDSTEIMRVENHEINERRGQPSELIISGRGFETFFENRIVGSNKTYPTSGESADYLLISDNTWNQAVTLIEDHILASMLVDEGDAIPFVEVLAQVVGPGVEADRSLKKGDLYTRLLELLSVEGLGVQVVRPGLWSPLEVGSPNVAIIIHTGIDRSDQIIYSNDTGEIESADYLWSDKPNKNAALVTGRWVETMVTTEEEGINRRVMMVDASDIDDQYVPFPIGEDLDAVVAAMQERGLAAIAAQNELALTKVEASKNVSKAAYRTDFNIGDYITVQGSYNESTIMQISEYVEIEDKDGKVEYPTLAVI